MTVGKSLGGIVHDPVWPHLFDTPIRYVYRAMGSYLYLANLSAICIGSHLFDKASMCQVQTVVRAVGTRFAAKTVSTTVVAAVVSSTAKAVTLSQEFIGHGLGLAKQKKHRLPWCFFPAHMYHW